jgi:hypothetical protein
MFGRVEVEEQMTGDERFSCSSARRRPRLIPGSTAVGELVLGIGIA